MVGLDAEHRPCSVSNCARHAIDSERAESEHWIITIHYCDEHARELKKGVPVGPVGLDASRLEVEPKGTREPLIPAVHAIGPQG
jgi:hypothetical protein